MLSPQDIRGKEFSKAVFGGYDAAAVDVFLEEVETDYGTIYKENAVLKGKLKVLVEKVEEYRSTEDAMRMALLTAQKMADDIIAEANSKKEAMLAEASGEVERIRAANAQAIAVENAKLSAAKEQTAAFLQASQQLLSRQQEFLTRLEGVTGADIPAAAPAEPAEAPAEEEIEEPAAEEAAAPAPAVPAAEEEDGEVEFGDAIKDISAVITGALADGPEIEEPAPDEKTKVLGAVSDAAAQWSEDDEKTTPRPRFQFDDLQFGSNYNSK